jgi:hypothetical protein
VLFDAPSLTHTPAAPPASDPRRLHERDDEVLARLDGVRDRFRLYDEFLLGERVGQRRAVRDFRGYPAVDPLTNRRYLDVLEYARRDPGILTDVNVRWVLPASHFRFGTTMSFLLPLTGGAFVPRGDQIFEAKHPAPLIAWYGAATLVADPAQVLSQVRAIEEPSGERRRAVIEPAAVAQDPQLARLLTAATSAPGSAPGTLASYAPDEIAFTIDAPREGIVVLNELTFPGWTVEVDGEPAVPVSANYLLRAVRVGSGHHAICWRFAPPGLRILLDGYVLALAIMLVAAAWPRRPRPATQAGPPDRGQPRSSRPVG